MTRPDQALEKARGLHAKGRFDEALAAYEHVLRLEPGSRWALWGMTSLLEMARSERYHPGLAIRFTQRLTDPASNHQALARGAALQLRFRHELDGMPAIEPLLSNLRRDPLLQGMLRRTVNLDPVFERFLWRLRQHLLDHAQPADLGLASALAQQAHNNEHVFPAPEGELERVQMLLGRWLLADPSPLEIALVAMYRPLAELPQAEAFVRRPLGSWPGELRDLIRTALHDRAEERQIAEAVPGFVPIEDEISRRVRAMYEQNPYPRWLTLPLLPRIDLLAELAKGYPALTRPPAVDGPLRILSAGCGTGQHALSLAGNYRRAEVTAFDLSRSSIAYGAREARRRGIKNIAFFHGDILRAPELGRRFHVIESIGVIHHMGDPGAGLAALTQTLEPGGLVRLGLYSEEARAIIAAARRKIAELGLDGSRDAIQRFRHGVMTEPAFAELAGLTGWDDFYSTSAARDLMFHVQEHRYDVSAIAALLERCGLQFIGFEFVAGFNGAQAQGARDVYAKAHPGDRAMADLGRWAELERQNPGLFQGYTFWAQKAGG